MEIFGGFMVMMSIIGLFLAVIWLIMPFVVFAIKGKQDRTLDVLEGIERRLAALESRLAPIEPDQCTAAPPESISPSAVSEPPQPENTGVLTESAAEKSDPEIPPVV